MTIDAKNFSEAVLEQASAWIVRLSDGATERDHQDFAVWLAQSRGHRHAFDEMMLLWDIMGTDLASNEQATITALLGKVSTDNGLEASNDGSSRPKAIVTQLLMAKPSVEPKTFPLFASLAAMAASVLFVVFALYTSPSAPKPNVEIAQTLYVTPIGKQQRFTLKDGSIIELNTGSKIAVKYSNEQRQLELLHGEAFFAVQPDPDRPFVVTAGAGTVTAIGTAFNIQLSPSLLAPGTMSVAVTEGHVRLTTSLSNDDAPVALGQQAHVTAQGHIGAVEAADLTQISAWREKILVFRGRELAVALEELNRYLPDPVDTADPSLHRLNISGTFSLEEPEATLDAIIQAFGLQSYRNPFNNQRRLYLR